MDSELLLKRVTDASPEQRTTFERLHHVGVQTSNLENCIAWYGDFFSAITTWALNEFSELTKSRLPGISRLVELRAGPIRFHVFNVSPGPGKAVPTRYDQFQHCCFEVRSADMLVHWRARWFELFNSGRYMFASAEPATEIVEDAEGVRSFYALDVNGLEYEFTWLGGRLSQERYPMNVATAREMIYGNRPYGLEYLLLPMRWKSPSADSETISLAAPAQHGTADGCLLPPAKSVPDLFWFRWITGHQISFIAWQLLAAAIDEIVHYPRESRALPSARAALFTMCYSAMLVYSSSVPRDLYASFVRPRLARQHPAFSGTWARDYRSVARFLRGTDDLGGGPEVRELLAARDVNHEVHEGVTVKLVPNGHSLLRTALESSAATRPPNAMAFLLYDDFFLTERREICYGMVLKQLVRRVVACNADLACNGLYPSCASSHCEEPPAFKSPPIAAIAQQIPHILAATAATAATPNETSHLLPEMQLL